MAFAYLHEQQSTMIANPLDLRLEYKQREHPDVCQCMTNQQSPTRGVSGVCPSYDPIDERTLADNAVVGGAFEDRLKLMHFDRAARMKLQ